MKIALDAMGGDFSPSNNIEGAIMALKNPEIEILLVGDLDILNEELIKHEYDENRIATVKSEGFVTDQEQPGIALRRKPNASVNVCSGLVKEGLAAGFLSCGNTGAIFASATFILGLFEGLDRPCVGAAVFGFAPNTLILDLGLNVDPTPAQLLDFTAIGISQVKILYGIENPTVGLLSNGSEPNKGNRLIKTTHDLLSKSNINFSGNVEGNDVASGKVNVVVCDGFTGNVLLKLIEGIGESIYQYLDSNIKDEKYDEYIQNISNQTNAMREHGGGPIFGINGIVIIGHGASRPKAISNGLNLIHQLSINNYVDKSRTELYKIRKSLIY